MLERKFIKPSIFQITQTTMSFTETKVQEVLYARHNGKWHRACDDKLETAIAIVKGQNPMYGRELTASETQDLKERHLAKSENREGTLRW
jgi:hypothetical protein